MKMKQGALMTSLMVSLVIHLAIAGVFRAMGTHPPSQPVVEPSILVPVTISKPKKTPVEKPPIVKPEKKEPRKIAEKPVPKPIQNPNPVPVSHHRSMTKPAAKPEETTPVFGVSRKTLAHDASETMAVRIGNTLMKEQEATFTPPDTVKDYITFPVFELTTLPEFRLKITPEYPEPLKNEECEGEVALSVTIDNTGKVTGVTVLRASHMLFAKASVEAVKRSRFIPATRNGSAVGTVLDDLVYTFVLDN